MLRNLKILVLLSVVLVVVTGCSTKFAPRESVKAPEPIADSSGEYVCPYTSDGVVADWVVKGKYAGAGAAAGKAVGQEAGKSVVKSIPLVGGLFGGKVGESAGRAAAIEAAGGWDYIRETSDLSFNSIDDMMAYLYVNYYRSNEHWGDVIGYAGNIYKELKDEGRWRKISRKYAVDM